LFAQSITESTLKTGIKWLFKWWSEYMTITGPGLLTRPYSDFADGEIRQLLDSQASDEYGDYIPNIDAFMELLVTKSCTRDTNAQLFVALLRSCNIETRLVCSLQPVPYKISSTTKQSTANKIKDNDDTQKPMFQYRPSYKSYVDPNVQLRQPKAKPPTVWAEVYCPDTECWMTIDPIRQHIGSSFMEPVAKNHTTQLSWVLAFLDPYHVRDVTRRYTANLDKALRLREHPLTKREKEAGMKPWSHIVLQIIGDKPTSKRDHRELQLLEKNQVKELMPTAISAFKNHPLYALERHLLKFQVLHPTKRPVLGSIRGEKVYPRSSVMTVCTAETYLKLGRVVKQGEQPVKTVKAHAFTVEKKRLKEQAKQEGHDFTVACYGEWQTELYVPPPVVDVSCNAFFFSLTFEYADTKIIGQTTKKFIW
jgi:xeroderma pigmentosum group C-complementing protein